MNVHHALVPVLCLAGCAAFVDSNLTVTHPSHEPMPSPPRISVFGLYNGGRLDEDAWKRVAPLLATAIGNDCTLGYSDAMRVAQEDLFDKIDHDAADTGVTDTILQQVDAHAAGNLILAVNSAGQLRTSGDSMAARAVGQAAANRHGPVGGPIDDAGMQITVVLYSVEHHQTLTTVELRYSGRDLDDAFRQLAAKLAPLVPGASCASWKWK